MTHERSRKDGGPRIGDHGEQARPGGRCFNNYASLTLLSALPRISYGGVESYSKPLHLKNLSGVFLSLHSID